MSRVASRRLSAMLSAMGAGASTNAATPFASVEAALAAGKTQDEVGARMATQGETKEAVTETAPAADADAKPEKRKPEKRKGLSQLIIPYHVDATGNISRPEHLIAWWVRIFSFLGNDDLNYQLRYLCRLFRDSLATFTVSASSAGYAMHRPNYPDRFSAEMKLNNIVLEFSANDHNDKWAVNMSPVDGGRGWNMMVVNSKTGALRGVLKSYDTWGNGYECKSWTPKDGW